jgi:hypothetical protein
MGQPASSWLTNMKACCIRPDHLGLLQREALEALVRDLPLRVVELTDEKGFYMALLQVGSTWYFCW